LQTHFQIIEAMDILSLPSIPHRLELFGKHKARLLKMQ
jgi:hypothetical protein